MTSANDAHCVSCGAPLTGPYCSQCGEAAPHHGYSLAHLGEEALESFAHLDGRIFASFRALLLQPGLLPFDFLRGRRRTQMGPVQLFVVCNVIYFLLQPFTAFAPFTSTLEIQTTARAWSGFAREFTNAKIAAEHTTAADYAAEFNHTAHLQGKSLIVFMVPIFALGVWALYGRKRRYYAEHLVFSFYLYAFLVLWMGLATLALSKPVIYGLTHNWNHVDAVSSAVITLPVTMYLLLAVKRMYGGGWWTSAIAAAALSGWMVAVLTIYRFILLLTTYSAT
jgi:hypothetical protein